MSFRGGEPHTVIGSTIGLVTQCEDNLIANIDGEAAEQGAGHGRHRVKGIEHEGVGDGLTRLDIENGVVHCSQDTLIGVIPTACRIIEHTGELRIGVRWIHPAMSAVMLVVLALFWSEMFYLKGAETGLVIVVVLTSYPALLMAFNSSWVTVKPGVVESYVGPIPCPGGRRRLDPAEIEAIFSIKVRGMAGRGGVSERYSLMATTRGGGKTVTILDAFETQEEATKAERVLLHRLNALRPQGAAPVSWL